MNSEGETEQKRLSLRKIKSSGNKGECAKEKAAKARVVVVAVAVDEDGEGDGEGD